MNAYKTLLLLQAIISSPFQRDNCKLCTSLLGEGPCTPHHLNDKNLIYGGH